MHSPQPKIFQPLVNQSGFALVLSLLTLALLSTLGVAAVYQSSSEVTVVGNERLGNTLLMGADAGAEFGKNRIWAQSGFGVGNGVNFGSLDNYFTANPLPLTMGPNSLGNNIYYEVTVPAQVTVPGVVLPLSGYDALSDGSKRIVTFQARSWLDDNGNAQYDAGEKSRMVTSRVSYEFGSLSFPYGVLTQNTECLLCHANIIGDVVSLNNMSIRKMDEAYSTILGKVYTMGTTNLNQANSRVVNAYTDQNGDYSTVENLGETALDITTGYADPERFPVDASGNPSFPKIENLTYYEGLANSYDGGIGSTLSGGTIDAVPLGSTFAANLANIGTVSKTYNGNLILTGTPGNCIQLNGPIVITGDLIMSGCVAGEGSIYTGGNVLIPDSITYTNPSLDRLAFAAGGNIVIGDYRDTSGNPNKTQRKIGGGKFIKKQLWQFNTTVQTNFPVGKRRYYAADDGLIYTDGKTTITPDVNDVVIAYTPTANAAGNSRWLTDNEYMNTYVNQTTGVTQLDALAYTANGIFGIQRRGTKQMTINGALVSADIGILVPGRAKDLGLKKTYDPAGIGLTLVYDNRMETFLSVARNPTKRTLTWKEGR